MIGPKKHLRGRGGVLGGILVETLCDLVVDPMDIRPETGIDCEFCKEALALRRRKRKIAELEGTIEALREELGMDSYKNPKPTVDAVIVLGMPDESDYTQDLIVLVKRKNPPYGWALPGGFVNEGESFEAACVREVKEEVTLDIDLDEQFYVYSDPFRDPRQHVATTVFLCTLQEGASDIPVAADDAGEVKVVSFAEALTMDLAFDHERVLRDVLHYMESGERPLPSLS
jgi:8-oxo-dGTP diphosphatase